MSEESTPTPEAQEESTSQKNSEVTPHNSPENSGEKPGDNEGENLSKGMAARINKLQEQHKAEIEALKAASTERDTL